MGHQALRDRIPSFDIRFSTVLRFAVLYIPSFDPPLVDSTFIIRYLFAFGGFAFVESL